MKLLFVTIAALLSNANAQDDVVFEDDALVSIGSLNKMKLKSQRREKEALQIAE